MARANGDGQIGFRTHSVHQCKFDGNGDGTCKQTFMTAQNIIRYREFPGFPLRPENLEKWEGFFQSGNFKQIGKVSENHIKYWKTQGISDKCFLLFFNDI